MAAPSAVPTASWRESLAALALVALPAVARGVILRRPRVVGLLARLDLDRRAVRHLQRLRARHGAGVVLLRVPRWRLALALDAPAARRVLQGSPAPFVVATPEKVAALAHFQPHGLLVSTGEARAARRRLHESVLDTGRPVHHLADELLVPVREEAAVVRAAADRRGELDWDAFAAGWWRVVRRVVLGDGARDDHEVTDLLRRLRADANWAALRPRRDGLRTAFEARLAEHLARADPGSLAAVLAWTPTDPGLDPEGQVPQWLFAFDAAGMATHRALGLLAAHPERAARARAEAARRGDGDHELPHLRACVLESVRLWPTTPLVLRRTTAPTTWDGGATLEADTTIAVVSCYFHRDDERLPDADRFLPELWWRGAGPDTVALLPFSMGPAACPGRDLVLMVASAWLAEVVGERELFVRSSRPPLEAGRPLPRALDPFRLRIGVAPLRPG